MKTVLKFLGLATLVVSMPLMALSASAAEFREAGSAVHALNGAKAPAPKGLFAAEPQPEKIQVAGRRGRFLGPAIIGGIVAGALIAGASRAHADERRYYSRRRYVNRCDRWSWQCDHGERWACRELYRYCD